MMQSELGLKIHILEQTVNTLRSQLGMISVAFSCQTPQFKSSLRLSSAEALRIF